MGDCPAALTKALSVKVIPSLLYDCDLWGLSELHAMVCVHKSPFLSDFLGPVLGALKPMLGSLRRLSICPCTGCFRFLRFWNLLSHTWRSSPIPCTAVGLYLNCRGGLTVGSVCCLGGAAGAVGGPSPAWPAGGGHRQGACLAHYPRLLCCLACRLLPCTVPFSLWVGLLYMVVYEGFYFAFLPYLLGAFICFAA